MTSPVTFSPFSFPLTDPGPSRHALASFPTPGAQTVGGPAYSTSTEHLARIIQPLIETKDTEISIPTLAAQLSQFEAALSDGTSLTPRFDFQATKKDLLARLATLEGYLRASGLGALSLNQDGPVDLNVLAIQRANEAQTLFMTSQRAKEAGGIVNGILSQ